MRLRFAKMSGAGNDFVVLDNRRNRITRRSGLARRLCDRHEGIGADGLLLVEPSRRYHYRMRYYNADGSEGGMCGNGARCIGWFAYLRRIAPKEHQLEALGSAYSASIRGHERISISFPDPSPLVPNWKLSSKDANVGIVSYIDTGSPHAVIRLRRGGLKTLHAEDVGRFIRYDRSFQPRGTNVNFVEVSDSTHIQIRTYERGVEAETKACGTGSIACSVVGTNLWGLKSPVSVKVAGGTLKVSFRTVGNEVTDVKLEGKARIVYEGAINV